MKSQRRRKPATADNDIDVQRSGESQFETLKTFWITSKEMGNPKSLGWATAQHTIFFVSFDSGVNHCESWSTSEA